MINRISGFNSGLDTEKIVADMVRADSARKFSLQRQSIEKQWQMEAYRDINKSIASFLYQAKRDFGLEQDYKGNIRSSSVDDFSWVKTAVSSDTSIATAVSSNETVDGEHLLNITQLASGIQMGSKNSIAETDILFASDTTVTINGEDLLIAGGSTIKDLVSAINSNANLNEDIRASYDSNLGRFFLNTKNTGSDATIEISGNSEVDTLFQDTLDMNVMIDGVNSDFTTATTFSGKNAIVEYNGLNLEFQSNSFEVNGLNINAKSVGSVSVNITADTDKIKEKITKFVEGYNELVDKLSKLVSEKKAKGYNPLLQHEKDNMKEKEIDLWETKAKEGILSSDSTITSALANVRNLLFKDVQNATGTYSNLANLGINTGNYKEGGKLFIDEDRLDEVLSTDVDSVMEVFFNVSGEVSDTSSLDKADYDTKMDNTGIIGRIFDELGGTLKTLLNKAGEGDGSSMIRDVKPNAFLEYSKEYSGKSIIYKAQQSINKLIENETLKIAKREQDYWNKFTRLEKSLQTMNSRASSIMSMLG